MEKLKPHQRKLWRRIYLGAFESGSTTDESAEMAHHAVQQWEDVGAFDDPAIETAFTAPMAVVLPGDPQAAYGIIQREQLDEHLFVAFGQPSDGVGFVLIAKTPIGTKLASVALENNFRTMITHAQALSSKP